MNIQGRWFRLFPYGRFRVCPADGVICGIPGRKVRRCLNTNDSRHLHEISQTVLLSAGTFSVQQRRFPRRHLRPIV